VQSKNVNYRFQIPDSKIKGKNELLIYPPRDYLTVDKIMSEPGFTGFKDLQDLDEHFILSVFILNIRFIRGAIEAD
jgi:hypothetical protein